jgi:acetoin utilization deacetylase AcuC-like enzyme
MRVVHSARHRLHAPTREVADGGAIGMYEVPERAEIIRRALEADGGFDVIEPAGHGADPIAAVHDPAMMEFLEGLWHDWRVAGEEPDEIFPDTFPLPAYGEGMGLGREPRAPRARIGRWCFDTATPVVEGTYAAARAAVDVALTASDLVLGGERFAYGLCRPPGHHAARAMFGGYCFFNNAAIVAESLVRRTAEPVAILDVDYHHGNGTQQIFYGRGDVLYVSLHGDPDRAYPYFSGFAEEVGTGEGEGATLNVPLPEGCPDEHYLAALERGLEAIAGFGGCRRAPDSPRPRRPPAGSPRSRRAIEDP